MSLSHCFQISNRDVALQVSLCKDVHFPLELEYKTLCALKKLNLDQKATGEKRMHQTVEL